jgi:hypothetical protein
VFAGSVFCSLGVPLALAKHAASDEELDHLTVMRRRQTTVLILLLSFTLCVSLAIAWGMPWIERQLHVTFGQGFVFALPATLLCAVISDYVHGLYTGLTATPAGANNPVERASRSHRLRAAAARGHFFAGLGRGHRALLHVGHSGGRFLYRDEVCLESRVGLADLKPLVNDLLPAAAFRVFLGILCVH